MAYTRAEFRERIRSRMGWPSADTFAVDLELNDYINDSLRELHSLLVSIHKPGSWGIATGTDTTTPGVPAITLPADFGRLVNISLLRDGVEYPMTPFDIILTPFDFNQRSWTANGVRYHVTGDDSSGWSVSFQPTPGAVETVIFNYIKAPPNLAADGNSSWMGEDEYVVLDVMLKCIQKEEDDPSTVLSQKTQYEERLKRQAAPIDVGQPRTVQDARSLEGFSVSGFGSPEGLWWWR